MVFEILNRLFWKLKISSHVYFKDEDFVGFSCCLTNSSHIWQVPSPLSALSVTNCSVPQHTGSPTSSLTSKSCRRTLTGRPRRERSNVSPTNRETCPIFHCRNQYSSLIQVKSTYTNMYICMCIHPTCCKFCTLLFCWSFTVHEFSPLAQSFIPWMFTYNLPIKMQRIMTGTLFKLEFRSYELHVYLWTLWFCRSDTAAFATQPV